MRHARFLLLLRSPIDTLRSIIRMGRDLYPVEWFKDPQRALAHYEVRLAFMQACATRARAIRSAFLEADRIIENTDECVAGLSEWLDLRTPLRNDYRLFTHTGEPNFGDASNRILRGAVTGARTPLNDVHVPPEIVQDATCAHERCRDVLLRRCRTRI